MYYVINRVISNCHICKHIYLPVDIPKVPNNIEEVGSKSVDIAAPQYHIIRDPPDGKPEFLVIEINLPGIVSTSSRHGIYQKEFLSD